MTKINLNRNIYPYGKFYDSSRVKIPTDEQNWTGIIIYVHPSAETNRIIGSLEGYFYSKLPLPNEGEGNPLVQRTQMKEFEDKYRGEFIPFEK
jgi:hypothetical protein